MYKVQRIQVLNVLYIRINKGNNKKFMIKCIIIQNLKRYMKKKIKDYKYFFILVNCESSLYIFWKVNNYLEMKLSL